MLLPWSINLPITSLNKFGFTLEKYSTLLYSLGVATFSNVAMSDMVFGDCFALATHWSKAARSGVAMALNFIPEKPGPL
ncbi:hypothetical protein D3C76_1496760 [compost metagenome]